MVRIFEIKDKDNKIIYLTDEQWKHIITRHSDVNIEEMKETILNPLIIKQDKIDRFLLYYYRFNKLKRSYLMVAVKYLNDEGFIITGFYTKHIRK